MLNVPLTIHEAIQGAKVKIPTPDGAIRVNIPKGTTSGTMMRIKGRGLPKTSESRGDLRLVLQPTPPKTDDQEALELAAALDAFYSEPLRDNWD